MGFVPHPYQIWTQQTKAADSPSSLHMQHQFTIFENGQL